MRRSSTPRPWRRPASRANTPNPNGRRNSEGRGRATPPACCAKRPRAWPRARMSSGATGGRRPSARRSCGASIGLATDECLSKGITSFVDAGEGFSTVDALRAMARNNQLRLRLWVMLLELQPGAGRQPGPLPHYRRRRQSPDRARHQALHGRRAGLARRLAAGAVCRPARQPRAQHHRPGRDPQDRRAGHRARVPALRARHRRPRQPRNAEHLRAGVPRTTRTRRTCAGASSTRST